MEKDHGRIRLKILKYEHPGKFFASILTETAGNFSSWHKDMNRHLNAVYEQSPRVISNKPKENEIVAALCNNTWHRVKITSIIQKATETIFKCYMIDEGSTIQTSASRLITLPPKFLKFPVQVHRCCLWGVQPVSMNVELVDTGLEVRNRPTQMWDPAAVNYMNQQIAECFGCDAEIINENSDGVLYVRLYFNSHEGLLDFNKSLVEKHFAIYSSDISNADLPVLISEEIRISNVSDIYKQNKSSSGANSDSIPLPALSFSSHSQALSEVHSTERNPHGLTDLTTATFGRGLAKTSGNKRSLVNHEPNLKVPIQSIPTEHLVQRCDEQSFSTVTGSLDQQRPKTSWGGKVLEESFLQQRKTQQKEPSKEFSMQSKLKELVTLIPKGHAEDVPSNSPNPSKIIRDDIVREILSQRHLNAVNCSDQIVSTEKAMDLMTVRQDQPMTKPLLGILAHGKSLPLRAINVSDVGFHPAVKEALVDLDIETAFGIMPFVWPAVVNCRHIIGVCPLKSDISLTYLPGVLSMLLEPSSYFELPRGKGPLALILVPTWKRGRQIADQVEKFIEYFPTYVKHIQTIVLYAGGSEEKDEVRFNLLRGCDILISTPNSLRRMLDEDFTNFKRLCHVILDDSQILAARYPTEVEDIMQRYKLVLSERKKQKLPSQILIFAKQWDQNLNLFFKKYTKEAIVVISSRLEAAIYGDVKQLVTMTKSLNKLTTFCNVIDTLKQSTERVAVFTSDLREAEELNKATKSRGVYCFLIHEELTEDERKEAREQWLFSSHTKQFLVIICTDQCYADLAITDATRVVHYGLPDSKTKFGNRLACMLDFFIDRTNDVEPVLQPISQIILSEEYPERALSLFEILKRSITGENKQFDHYIKGYLSSLENDPEKRLCPLLKSFGKCVLEQSCKFRHILFPEDDSKKGQFSLNALLSSGEVTIKVIRVMNANSFYCHLIEHRSYPDSVRTNLKIQYQELFMDMLMYYSKESNHVPFSPSQMSGDLCTFQDKDNNFHRAKVAEKITYSKASSSYRVWLVDQGIMESATIEQLKVLPKKLAEIPYQAVEVVLCNLKPMDDSYDWTDKANTFVNDLIYEQTLVGKIMLRLGSTLWLSHLVHQTRLENVGVVSDKNIRHELIEKHFAQPNPEHIKNLYTMCRGKIDLPEHVLQNYFDYSMDHDLKYEVLPSSPAYSFMCIVCVNSPSKFYLQKWDNHDQLCELEDQIDKMQKEWMKTGYVSSSKEIFTLEVGSVCLGCSTDNKWYRCKVVSKTFDNYWEVFMLDYGDCEKVHTNCLRPLPIQFGRLPCQAIECELAYVKPKEDTWSPSAKDLMCDLSYFVNNSKKKLTVKVVDSMKCDRQSKYVVDVYSNEEEAVRFSTELVRHRQAVCADENSNIELLFASKESESEESLVDIMDNIPFLCATIYLNQGDVCLRANELENIMGYRHSGWDTELAESLAIPSVVKILGYVSNVEAHGIVLFSLTACCRDSERLCEMAINEKLPFHLLSCLEQARNPYVQCQGAEAFASLIRIDRFFKSGIHILMNTLVQFLEGYSSNSYNLKTLKFLCVAASQILEQTTDDSLCEKLMCKELIHQIFTHLEAAESEIHLEPWLQLLAAILYRSKSSAGHQEVHQVMMREKYLNLLLNFLTGSLDVKCLCYLLAVFQHLVLVSRKFKNELQKKNLFIILDSLLKKDIQSPALELCSDLWSRMSLNLPQPETLAGIPVDESLLDQKVVVPEVQWSQTNSSILLKFVIKQAEPRHFKITERHIVCRVETKDTVYSLDWELFDLIIPDRSKVKAQDSITFVKLVKASKASWTRLLQTKKKPPTLRTDFDHIMNSDEEVSDEENSQAFISLEKPIFNVKTSNDVINHCSSSGSASDDDSSDEFFDSDHEFEHFPLEK